MAIWADSPDDERKAALADLAAGRVSVVFSVDLFNEGVDVPAVDTLLLLRPTDSPTLFLQDILWEPPLRNGVVRVVRTFGISLLLLAPSGL